MKPVLLATMFASICLSALSAGTFADDVPSKTAAPVGTMSKDVMSAGTMSRVAIPHDTMSRAAPAASASEAKSETAPQDTMSRNANSQDKKAH